MTEKNAGFLVRLLAELIDILIFWMAINIAIYSLSGAKTLAEFVSGFAVYWAAIGLPLAILSVTYKPYFTHNFGGNIGKLLTGLRVTNLEGKYLTFKQALFRYTIAYIFSLTLFGLGFWSIIKDKEKRAFHDKAVGSKVVVARNIWPMGLLILGLLIFTHAFILTQSLNKFSHSTLRSELGFLLLNWKQETEDSKPKPSPLPQKTSTPSAELQNSQTDCDYNITLQIQQKINKGHFDVVKGPQWSPDCQNIAWSKWHSGTGGPENGTSSIDYSDEGVFNYNVKTKTYTTIYQPGPTGDLADLVGWKDNHTLLFETDHKNYSYDLNTKKLSSTPTNPAP
jgi:uncharacterized RDD family membrane protein YckC